MTRRYTLTIEVLSQDEMDEDQQERLKEVGGIDRLIELTLENSSDGIIDSARAELV